MPYQWSSAPPPALWHLRLWPHRSLSPRGFVIFIAATCGMFLLPLAAALGSATLWVLLPFITGAVALVWFFLRRSANDGQLCEDLTLWPDRIELTRHTPRGPARHWSANPYWVRLELHTNGGPVEDYLTLAGDERIVELGAFLAPEERRALYAELQDRLRRLDINAR